MSAQPAIRLFGLSGSLRKDSYSTAILKTLAEAIAGQAQLQIGDIASIPLYNQDEDGETPPAPVAAMRKLAADSAAVVLVSPEYNYGVSGVMKNAIDWLSRPAGKSCLIGKPFLIVTSSPGALGGVRAQAQIRESVIACGARPLIAGEVVIGSVAGKISGGRLTDKATLDFALKALSLLIGEAQVPAASKAA